MELYKRQVLHYEDEKSDKVYILELFVIGHEHDNDGKRLATLITSWGRRTSPRLSSQVKFEDVAYWRCQDEFRKLERAKRRAGYELIPESTLKDFQVPGYKRKIISRNKNSNKLLVSSNVKSALPTTKTSAENLHRNIL